VEISADLNHTCALDTDGQAHCWGEPSNGKTDVPANNQRYTAINTDAKGTCALRTSGIALCWSTEPVYDSAFIASQEWLDITLLPLCGVTQEGVIDCLSTSGRLAVPGNGPYTKIDRSGTLFCGLQTDGNLDCTGFESQQIETQNHIQSLLTEIDAFPPLVDFGLLSLGTTSSGVCGLDFDGKIHCAGSLLPADAIPGQ